MIRVRHYTRVSAMRKIMDERLIVARDKNRVFVELARSRKLSPRVAEGKYNLGQGRGNAYIEFDMEADLLSVIFSQLDQAYEYSIVGNVDLTGRTPVSFVNVF